MNNQTVDMKTKEEVTRPKPLQEVENNNGWIKIESEDDLPKESGEYLIFDEDLHQGTNYYSLFFKKFYYNGLEYEHNNVTHYQPLVKPPIY